MDSLSINEWKQVLPKNENESVKKLRNGIEYSIDYIKSIIVPQECYDIIIPKLNTLLVEMNIPIIKPYNVKQENWTRNQRTTNKNIHNEDKFTPLKKPIKSVSNIGLDAMKLNLNKLTDKNYIDISLNMVKMVEDWLNIESSPSEIEKMGELIFNIASNNRMFSKLYADLYSYLSTNNKIISDTFYVNFVKYRSLFEHIDEVNDLDDYDSFCKINVTNEKRRAVSMFMVNLAKNNMLQSSELYDIILSLLEKIKNMIHSETNILINQELIDNIIILYDDGMLYNNLPSFSLNDNQVIEYIRYIATTPKNDLPGINSKTKFKCMDYIKI